MPGTNLLGPYGTGVNESYAPPDFGDSGSTQDSWYVDCSSDVADDGTKWTARWANRVMQQLRRAVDGMGIARNETNGDSLYQAILKAHRPIENVGGGASLHKGEKMPEWVHQMRTLVGAGTVTVNVVGDTVVITGAAGGESVALQNLGTGVPIYKGVSGSVHQFRSILATVGVEVVAGANEATFRLAPIGGWQIMLRNAESAGAPAGVAMDELTEITNPALDDWLMLQRNPGRQLRKVKRRNIGGLWEIAAQTEIASPTATVEMLFEADRYSKLILSLDNWSVTTTNNGLPEFIEACLMNGSSVITRAPMRESSVVSNAYPDDVSGTLEWALSNLNHRSVIMTEINLQSALSATPWAGTFPADPKLFGYAAPTDNEAFPLQRYVCVGIGSGSGTFKAPSARAGATPVNKLRLRWLKFTSLHTDVFTVVNTTAGRATLYGLRRA